MAVGILDVFHANEGSGRRPIAFLPRRVPTLTLVIMPSAYSGVNGSRKAGANKLVDMRINDSSSKFASWDR